MEQPTAFGEKILDLMKQQCLTKKMVSASLDILPDHFNRILKSPHTGITLQMTVKLASILHVSPLVLMHILYSQDGVKWDPEEAKFILIFDLFYRLMSDDQEVIVHTAQTLLDLHGERPFSPENAERIATLRLSPICIKRGGPSRTKKRPA